MYERFYDWANDIGAKIVNSTGEHGTELIKKIIFDIRGEQLPGKFLEKLMTRLAEYRTDRDLNLADIEIDPEIFGKTLWGNSFHYTKSAIIAGLLNAIASKPQIKRSGK
ncbi:hypothetical protein KEJ15_08470 [Candidatus Bathyarchaeota archaeon]|nr:hypothetical protein [Candidatus Bathyarchaeota archaeon]